MKTNVAICTLLGLIITSFSCHAEYRTWTDQEGHTIKAEFIQNADGSVSLRTEQKKLIHVDISQLSADDQEYVLSLTPPRYSVDVQELTDTHSMAFDTGDNDNDIRDTVAKFKVTLTRESMVDYKGTVKAELYIIGSRTLGDKFILLNKTVTDVKSSSDMDEKFSFTSGDIDFKNLEAGGTEGLGMQYAGYLLVVVDGDGRMSEAKSNHSEFKENVAKIRTSSQGGEIDLPCSASFE